MDGNLITENRGSYIKAYFFPQYINEQIKIHSKDYAAIDLKAVCSSRDWQYWQYPLPPSPPHQSIFELKGTLENIQFCALSILPLPFYHNVKFNVNIK